MFSYMGAHRVGSQLAQWESALPVSQFICPQAYSLGTAVGGERCYRLCLSGRKFGDSHDSSVFWTHTLLDSVAQGEAGSYPGSACQCRHELRTSTRRSDSSVPSVVSFFLPSASFFLVQLCYISSDSLPQYLPTFPTPPASFSARKVRKEL